MKTAMIAAGMLCALNAAGQQLGTGADGPLSSFEVNLSGDRRFDLSIGQDQIESTSTLNTEATVFVPQAWDYDETDGLEFGSVRAGSMISAVIESDADRLQGELRVEAFAFETPESDSASARLFHNIAVVADDLEGVYDIVLSIDADSSLAGFGRSTLTWAFGADGVSDRGRVASNGSDSLVVVYEDVDLTSMFFSLNARNDAGTDDPVLDSTATLNVDWSIELIPVPAPGSAAGLLMLGGLALRRRR